MGNGGSISPIDTGAWYTGAQNGDPPLADSYEYRVTSLINDTMIGPDTRISLAGVYYYINNTLQSGATLPTAWETIVAQQVLQLGVGTQQVAMEILATAVIEIRKVSDNSCTTTINVQLNLLKGGAN